MPITPDNCDDFLMHVSGWHVNRNNQTENPLQHRPDVWIWDDHGGELTTIVWQNLQQVLFPVGVQYGWGIYDETRQNLLLCMVKRFTPKILMITVSRWRHDNFMDAPGQPCIPNTQSCIPKLQTVPNMEIVLFMPPSSTSYVDARMHSYEAILHPASRDKAVAEEYKVTSTFPLSLSVPTHILTTRTFVKSIISLTKMMQPPLHFHCVQQIGTPNNGQKHGNLDRFILNILSAHILHQPPYVNIRSHVIWTLTRRTEQNVVILQYHRRKSLRKRLRLLPHPVPHLHSTLLPRVPRKIIARVRPQIFQTRLQRLQREMARNAPQPRRREPQPTMARTK